MTLTKYFRKNILIHARNFGLAQKNYYSSQRKLVERKYRIHPFIIFVVAFY